jgi:type II secretory ATPase GspE/PulE/Tfp pilus assembly ATPase PilB-like protein
MDDALKSPGFRHAQQQLDDALGRRAEAMMFDSTLQDASVRYLIDGVWNDVASTGAENVRAAVESIRVLCGLNPQASARREGGTFTIHRGGATIPGVLTSQGGAGGGRTAVQLQIPRASFRSLDELGMPPDTQERLRQLIAQPKGLILFSGPPGAGVRSTINALLESADRYLRDFASLEDEADRQEEVENVPVATCRPGGPETPATALLRLIRTEPNVVAVRCPLDQEMGSLICQHAVNNQLFLGMLRSTNAAEALLQFLALKVPPADFASAITAVLNQRLVRRLCPQCKESHTLPPEIARQFTVPAGQTPAFFRPPSVESVGASAGSKSSRRERVCPACGGLGYVGRTAIFELMVVNHTIRKILQIGPRADLITQAAQRAGMRTLHEEGRTLVGQGITSLMELQRALK